MAVGDINIKRIIIQPSQYIPPTGSVIQVVSAFKNDTFSTNSNSFVDVTGMSAAITPSAISSKVLIRASMHLGPASGSYGPVMRLMRNSTEVSPAASGGSGSGWNVYYADNGWPEFLSIEFLDSPSSTSSLTYKMQMTSGISATVYLNRTTNDGWRGSSSITAMEIKG
jgi:hypothetical protein